MHHFDRSIYVVDCQANDYMSRLQDATTVELVSFSTDKGQSGHDPLKRFWKGRDGVSRVTIL